MGPRAGRRRRRDDGVEVNERFSDTLTHEVIEYRKCRKSWAYFIHNYCFIYDAVDRGWIPFHLWPAQRHVIAQMDSHQFTAILKPRQVGLTWCALAYALWMMLFHPAASILLFSLREKEAVDILARLVGMHKRLPFFLQEKHSGNTTEWRMANGSVARAFPCNRGDSYQGTLAIVDEADLIADFDGLLLSVKPTVDAGGKLIALSKVDKSKPNSGFKNTYKAWKKMSGTRCGVFLPYWIRPGRTRAWYRDQRDEILARTGSLDALWETYPRTDAEALAQNTQDKRIPAEWLLRGYEELDAVPENVLIAAVKAHNDASTGENEWKKINWTIPRAQVFRLPEPGAQYVIGADPAEGNPASDESVFTVINARTWEQVAVIGGRVEPTLFADYIRQASMFYGKAKAMIERNNHGHTVIASLRSSYVKLLNGDDGRPGFLTHLKSKTLAYNDAAGAFRDGACMVHDDETHYQLGDIDGATMRAPEGNHDDRAMAFVLALQGAKKKVSTEVRSMND